MIIMFSVSVGGQTPLSIISIVTTYTSVSPLVNEIAVLWYELALLVNMIDLFLYNHEVRKYLAGFCFRFVRH